MSENNGAMTDSELEFVIEKLNHCLFEKAKHVIESLTRRKLNEGVLKIGRVEKSRDAWPGHWAR